MKRTLPLIFAHRGVSSLCPENTMAAFQKAVQMGADGIELDVHRSRDGKLVVCHDETIDRTTTGKGTIKDQDYNELSSIDAGKWFGSEYSGERMPLLEEVLVLLKPTTLLLNIELKTDYYFYPGIEEQTLSLVHRYGMEEQVIFSSFNHYTVVELKKRAPQVKGGILYSCHLVKPHIYAKGLLVDALHPPMHLATPEIIQDAHTAGLSVHAWFSREQFEEKLARIYLNSGVDMLITNYPQEYLKLR